MSNLPNAARLLNAALGYVESSPQWPVFPASATRKRPIIKTGIDHAEHASTNPDVIRGWHRDGMLEAFGMPTGAASGTVVIDVDKKHDGEAKLEELEGGLGPLPRVRVVRTQSGGLHIYLRHPGGMRIASVAGAETPLGRLLGGADGIDVRGDGGIVILPPSCGYVWIADDDEPLPEIPPLWLAAIQGKGDKPAPPRPVCRTPNATHAWSDSIAGSTIGAGGRSSTLYRRGAAAHLAGATDSEVLDLLLRINTARCSPSLNEREVQRIAASASRATGKTS